MTEPQSFLARYQSKVATSDGEILAMGARAWLDHGVLVVRPENFDNPVDAQMVRALGDQRYGKRDA